MVSRQAVYERETRESTVAVMTTRMARALRNPDRIRAMLDEIKRKMLSDSTCFSLRGTLIARKELLFDRYQELTGETDLRHLY